MDIRVGNGFDVHAVCSGDHVILCGVKIPCLFSLAGHSDADVGLHALTDAILGALCLGDIGQHFPPNDMQWKDTDSAQFLKYAAKLAQDHNFRINHVDITLLGESPKISPHRDAMQQKISQILGINIHHISIKATTTEKLGFIGREEGLAALATATLIAGHT